MDIPKLLFNKNRAWAKQMEDEEPGLFEQLSQGQSPECLWIGCADSRVPPDTLLDLPPGSLFVHRNIANVVSPSDPSSLSVIQYAVEVLKVKHIIVCGHYGCGGVNASMGAPLSGCIEGWLNPIREVSKMYHEELSSIDEAGQKSDRLCELNVIEQAAHVRSTEPVLRAWASGQELYVHGWIYRLKDGLIKDLQVSSAGS